MRKPTNMLASILITPDSVLYRVFVCPIFIPSISILHSPMAIQYKKKEKERKEGRKGGRMKGKRKKKRKNERKKERKGKKVRKKERKKERKEGRDRK